MANGVIGKLSLDISDVKKNIEEVNSFLGKIGANIDIKDTLSKKISNALKGLVDEAKKAGEEVAKAIDAGSKTGDSKSKSSELKEAIKLWKEYYNTMTQAESAYRKGDYGSYNNLRQEAQAIYDVVNKLKEEKEVYKEIAKERQKYENSLGVTANQVKAKNEIEQQKELANAIREVNKLKKETDKSILDAQKSQTDAEQQKLDHMVGLYQKYFEYKTKALNAGNTGNNASFDMYSELAHNIKDQIDLMDKYNEGLAQAAQNTDKFMAAQTGFQNAVNASDAKNAANNVKEYANSLIKLYDEQTKLNNALSSGKITEGSNEYAAATEKIEHLKESVVNAGEKIDDANRKAAESMQSVQIAADNLAQSEARLKDSGIEQKRTDKIEELKQHYFDLTNAIKRYNAERVTGNADGMATEQSKIDKIMEEVAAIEQSVNASEMEADKKREILNYVEQIKTAEQQHTANVQQAALGYNEINSQINGMMMRMFSLMTVIRAINNLISNTVDYVTEYSDKMNEIQIITQKSNDEIARLGQTYRKLAEDMNVSSLDMADAAIYFTRQGLAAEEIENRLVNVTRYAKTANVEFKDASEIITSVVNSMNLVEQEAEDGRNATQRVADVFLAVGDTAATSGQEIGEAMQKAAASAGAFGMSMEWLAAYIATVSETTRQEARTIGTAFNTIIARLHQIKQNGYNSEDETKINDVQKALAKIDVSLMDQNNEWRDMDTIFQEIGEAWGDLDGKTKSYIATTMAGVKQQNVFLALMNDLSKQTEEQSRAWQLYDIALNSAGTSEEKYATWTESVAAAQEHLTLAQEKFYSLLDSSVIKGWYNTLASVVDVITAGTAQFGKLNIIIPVTVGAILMLRVAFDNLRLAAAKAGAASVGSFMLNAHPIMAIITVVSLAITAFTALGAAINGISEASERAFTDSTEAIEENTKKIEAAEKHQKTIATIQQELNKKTELSRTEISKYNSELEAISEISPRAKAAVLNLQNGFGDQQEQLKTLNEELEKYIQKQETLTMMEGVKKYSNYQSDNLGFGLASRMRYWEELWGEIDGLEDFTNKLQEAYKRTSGSNVIEETLFGYKNSEGNKFLPEKIRNYIQEMIRADPNHAQTDQFWENLAQVIWMEYLGGDDSYKLGDFLLDEINTAVDDAMSIIGGEKLNPIDYKALREYLVGLIFGEDGELSITEYNDFSKVISSFIANVLAGGIESIDIPEYAKVASYIEQIWEKAGQVVDYNDEAYYKFKNSVQQYTFQTPGFSGVLGEAIKTLIGAGYDEYDIYSLLDELEINEWEDVVAYAVEKELNILQGRLQDLYEDYALSLWDFFGDEDEDADEILGRVDLEVLKLVDTLATAGIAFEDMKEATKDAETIDDYKEALKGLAEAANIVVSEDGLEGASEQVKSFSDTIGDITKSLETYKKVLDSISKGEAPSIDDIISTGHPELLAYVGDLSTLGKKTQELSDNVKNTLKNAILGSQEIMKASPYLEKGYATLKELIESGEDESADSWVAALVDTIWEIVTASNAAETAVKSLLQTLSEDAKKNTDLNWAKSNNFADQIRMLQQAYEEGGDAGVLHAWRSLGEDMQKGLADAYPGIVTELGNIERAFEEKVANIKEQQKNLYNGNVDLNDRPVIDTQRLIDAGWDVEGYEAGQKSTLYQMEEWAGNHEGAIKWNQDVIISVTPIMENGEVLSPDALNDYLTELFDKSTNTDELKANDAKGKNLLMNITLVEDGDFEGTQEKIDEITESTHALQEEMYAGEDSASGLAHALSVASKAANAKHFKDTWKAVVDLSKGTTTAEKAFETFNKDLEKYKKAQQEVVDVQDKLSKGLDVEESDVSALSDVLGKTAADILKDWPGAIDLFNEMTKAGQEVYEAMNQEAVLRILGVSSSDFSDIQGGLIAVQSSAKDTIAALMALGSFTIETEDLPQEGKSFKPDGNGGGSWVQFHDNAEVTFLKFNAKSSPFSPSSTPTTTTPQKGGGGGGGGGGKKEKTEVVKMLDNMGKVDDIQKWQQSYYQSQQKYYESTGQIQGVIAYMGREKEVIDEQTKSLTGNIKQIEEWIQKKKEELAGLKESDDKYAEVADDLDKLQKAHQDYTKQLVDNKTAIEELNQAIKEQRDKIRDMEIDLRETILKAIEDRERKTEDMLNAEIELENKIMDVIKRRYEKERDQIIETTNLKIEALQEERDLLEEQLRLRKEQADQEDKAKKLKELELQYQRISADPTRAKEAKKIQKDIAELREEMAWDAAEDEIKAQQESLEQQEQSLEDYIDYVHDYYEDLFEHPKLLIAEMEEIMSQTSDKILQWLKENDEEYAEYTAAQQEKTTKEWQQMLDDREGLIKTYWDEVEEIITKGDEYIIKFLQDNSADYAAAGKLQAEKYTEEWKKKLDDLRKAHEAIEAEFAPKYDVVEGGSGGGSGGGGGGPGGGKKYKYEATLTYINTDYGQKIVTGKGGEAKTEDEAKQLALAAAKANAKNYRDSVNVTYKAYRRGGIADFTGPAWLDGSPSEPERVLSPKQTELFETMVKALENMSRISIPTMPNFGDIDLTGSGNVSVGDIIVNVDNLDTDDDYEELAKKVSAILMERIGRTTVVGGLRINSF